MPYITYPHDEVDFVTVWEFFGREKFSNSVYEALMDKSMQAEFKHNYNEGKALLISNTGLRTADQFQKVLHSLNAKFLDYKGGTSPRASQNSTTYSATDLPPNHSIPLHQEMAYTSDNPKYIAFFCYQPANPGQKTTILGDMKSITENIPKEIAVKYEEKKLRLKRYLPSKDRVEKSLGLKKSWQEVFDTDCIREVEKIARKKNWVIERYPQGGISLLQDSVNPYKDHCGKRIWCNQAHVFTIESQKYWARSDGRTQDYEELCKAQHQDIRYTDHMCYEDLSPIDSQESLEIYKIIDSHKAAIELNQGDILILDNIQTAHGRSTYTGERKIFVSLMSSLC